MPDPKESEEEVVVDESAPEKAPEAPTNPEPDRQPARQGDTAKSE